MKFQKIVLEEKFQSLYQWNMYFFKVFVIDKDKTIHFHFNPDCYNVAEAVRIVNKFASTLHYHSNYKLENTLEWIKLSFVSKYRIAKIVEK